MDSGRLRNSCAAFALAAGVAAAGCAAPASPPEPLADGTAEAPAAANTWFQDLETTVLPSLRRERETTERIERESREPPIVPDCIFRIPRSSPVRGGIIGANNELGIFLLSKGSKDQVACGDKFTVLRGDSFVAELVVTHAFDDKSAATARTLYGVPLQKSDVRRGDSFVSWK